MIKSILLAISTLYALVSGFTGQAKALPKSQIHKPNLGISTSTISFATIDNMIATFLPKIENYQNNFIATHPAYFDSLTTHSQIPNTSTIPDQLSVKLGGKNISWSDTGIITSVKIPFSIQTLEYTMPDNTKGWQIIFRTKDSDGIIWTRSIGYGPEASSRTFGWIQ